MIRPKFKQDIRVFIDENPKFSSIDFIIDINNNTIVIKYAYDASYYFKCAIPNSLSIIKKEIVERKISISNDEDYHFKGYYCPGQFVTQEEFDVYGERNLYYAIKKWMNCLYEDLLTIPINRKIAEQAKIINDINDKIKDYDDDSYFSDLEITEIKTKIDKIEEDLKKQLEVQEKENKELKQSILELHKEFENLKLMTHSLNKKNWFKAFFYKTSAWLAKEENRKFLSNTAEIIKPMLPEEIKNIIQ
ncbi:MAG: hypothetical protein A2X02_05420 [Bacteroidetes bacterium GWF2_29_10]|nr:MAG: hypothetical protein A2X02_05420 [Bacteroidetes bacterium GWF2_29_10]